MEQFDAERLSDEIVDRIKEFCKDKLTEIRGKGLYLNEIIREDIFPVIDMYSTVIFYPTEDANNNGFHKTYLFHGEKIHFVYINTNQDREKQIFTSAHELGHVWKLDEHLEKVLGLKISHEFGEKIMNRFAAELLMPEELFRKFVDQKKIDICGMHGRITYGNMIEIITAAMNEYFVPYKAVLYRLYELGIVTEAVARVLYGEQETLPLSAIYKYSELYATSQGYSRLYHPDKLKFINGLKEKLDTALNKGTVPDCWLQTFYNKFGLSPSEPEGALTQEINMEGQKNG